MTVGFMLSTIVGRVLSIANLSDCVYSTIHDTVFFHFETVSSVYTEVCRLYFVSENNRHEL